MRGAWLQFLRRVSRRLTHVFAALDSRFAARCESFRNSSRSSSGGSSRSTDVPVVVVVVVVVVVAVVIGVVSRTSRIGLVVGDVPAYDRRS